jgi:hypothetical protein
MADDGPPFRRTSPRTNKGTHPQLEKDNELTGKAQRNILVPGHFGKKTPAVTVDNSTTIPAASTEKPDDSLAISSDSSDSSRSTTWDPSANHSDSSGSGDDSAPPAEAPPLSAKARIAATRKKVAAAKVQWELEDKTKKKDQLFQELIVVKQNNMIAEHNYQTVLGHKETILAKAKEQKAEIIELKGTCQDLQAQLQKSQAETMALKKKLDTAIKSKAALRVKGRSKLCPDDNETLLNLIELKAKTVLWGLVKFIQSPEEELDAAKYLVRYGELPREHCANKEMRAELAEMYSDKIKRAVFNKRNYTTAEEKKFYVKMWKANKPTLTVQDLLMCLRREIVSDEDMTKFQMYWEDYLPKQVGATEWDRNTRYYATISKAKRKDCKSHELKLVTPEDEAFLVLSIENGLQRWKEEFDIRQAADVGAEVLANGAEVSDERASKFDNHSGLYTSTTSGQNQYGGWSEQGLELFKQYVEWNVAARKDPKAEKVEEDCLYNLRVKWGIQCATAEEHNKLRARMKSARKRGRGEEPMPAMKKVIRTMRYIEESDEEED